MNRTEWIVRWALAVVLGVLGTAATLIGWHLWADHNLHHQLINMEIQRQQQQQRGLTPQPTTPPRAQPPGS